MDSPFALLAILENRDAPIILAYNDPPLTPRASITTILYPTLKAHRWSPPEIWR